MKLFLSTVLLALGSDVHAFTPATVVSGARRATMAVPQQSSWLQAATTEELEAVSSMRAGEIKKELESYGISTAAFLKVRTRNRSDKRSTQGTQAQRKDSYHHTDFC
jgi:hypothetical protein